MDEKDSRSSHPGPGNGQYVAVSAGGGKSHLAAALGYALVENGWRVLFARTTDLVQKLQVARRDLALEAALAKLDKYHLLILDDFTYVAKDQAETSVLFELIGTRYERRSLLITANQPFGDWGGIFPSQAHCIARNAPQDLSLPQLTCSPTANSRGSRNEAGKYGDTE